MLRSHIQTNNIRFFNSAIADPTLAAAGLGVGGTVGVVFASLAIITIAIFLILLTWRKMNKANTEPTGRPILQCMYIFINKCKYYLIDLFIFLKYFFVYIS